MKHEIWLVTDDTGFVWGWAFELMTGREVIAMAKQWVNVSAIRPASEWHRMTSFDNITDMVFE